jgi:hypothetical protein
MLQLAKRLERRRKLTLAVRLLLLLTSVTRDSTWRLRALTSRLLLLLPLMLARQQKLCCCSSRRHLISAARCCCCCCCSGRPLGTIPLLPAPAAFGPSTNHRPSNWRAHQLRPI